MAKKEIKTENTGGLEKELADKRAAWRKFRFAGSNSKSTNVKEARNLRKDIARILTSLNKNHAK